ncbi:triple tyrosine motif-containing protein [Pontibacter korlensis]|uniref:HTH luxR-type domain-containing protein n=1 Tax=Pontibacter korlensis TaxID=400092 RepID=A0A0E3ZDY3_9BACT|nr:triple tyrosine motif-containing protein [Pontibacter korlensis]AKD01973.1 hypothetical protein PKOR_00965 [Pontibacter korlensis]
MKKLFVVLVNIITLCYPILAQVKNEGIPYIKNYTQKQYKASPQNWAIVQDHRGVMYFGNSFGVLEFDGNHWRRISLANRTIARSLAVDKTGRVYVGGQDDFGYLQPDASGLMSYVSLKEKIAPQYRDFDDVWKIYTSDEGVFYCTVSGIYHLQHDRIKVYKSPGPPTGFPFMVQNKLLVPVPKKGIFELKHGTFGLIPGSEIVADFVITAILPYEKGESLLFTEEHGMYVYNGYSDFKKLSWPVEDYLIKNKIYSATRLTEGYAIGTAHDGLLVVDKAGKPRQHLNREKGLQNSNVIHVYQDQAGSLWLALNNGIAYVEINSAFTLFNATNGLPGTGYTSLLNKDVLYLGTNDGLYYKAWSNTENPLYPSPFKLVDNTQGQVYNLQKIKGKLLLSHHNGPFEIVNNTARKLSDHRGAWIFMPLANHPGYLVCGTYTGLLLYKFEKGQLVFQHKISGFDESSRVMEEDKEGNLWIAHGYKGVYKLRLGADMHKVESVSFYGEESGFPSNLFINVFKINGELVFTGESGVYKYNKRTDRFDAHPLLSKQFEQGVHVRKLVEDKDGDIWFSAGNQMGVLRKRSNGSFEVEKNIFNKLHGKLIGGFEHIAPYDQSNMLIGIDEGFVHYHPSYLQAKNLDHTFYTLIRQVNATDGLKDTLISAGAYLDAGQVAINQPNQAKLTLPFAFNSVKFTYSGVAYEGEEHVQYQYMLEGFDKSWSPWISTLQKEYTNLSEGTYTFKVKARDVYNRESREAMYTFTVLPPWYRSIWAKGGYVLLALLLLWVLKRLTDNRIRRHQEQARLEQEKALRLKEAEHMEQVLKAEKEIIKLNNEKLESELAHKSKELASSAMHVMHSLETIGKVRGQLQVVMEQVDDKEARHHLRKMLRSVEEDIKVDNNWDQFELHFNQIHQDFLRRLRDDYPDLTHRDIKLCAYLRMNLTSKEIASLLNLSLRGVETSRYRLRKKLNLGQEVNLTEFILKY